MTAHLSPTDEASFNIQIKNLTDEEFLDFWEETQQAENALCTEYQQTVVPVQGYKRLIVLELQLRSCQRRKSCGAWSSLKHIRFGPSGARTS